MPVRIALATALLALATGCELPPPVVPRLTPERVAERWLPPLVEGKTTRGELVAALGEPLPFDGGRVGVWRLLLVLDPAPLSADACEERLDEIELVWAHPGRPGAVVDLYALAERRERLLATGAMIPVGAEVHPDHPRHLLTREAEFHLVAAFRPDGVLARSALRRVMP